ncbi:DUF5615 family PIN-like protein [Trichlorobacter sp.]|uniref:DUF5615 family PIN-like protein n=1 Tax=Trichlorobacter sp. TaxID=2911007 RepID=UPI002A3692BD|nr:DUF5615 family PIN-like protein [Trichlorobacter sp.]MDY0383202.1 DUF5615 family PIN-like protein [Trichlorobacter sp.]
MKFLADVNIERRIILFLRSAGYDVIWAPEYDCRMKDEELLALAVQQQRILITNDKDFGNLVYFQKKAACGIVLFRIEDQNVRVKITILKNMLLRYQEKFGGHFVTIARKRIRFIPLEDV